MKGVSCAHCAAGQFTVPSHNVAVIVYDPYQVEQMMQRLNRLVWCEPFPQMRERAIADSQMLQQ